MNTSNIAARAARSATAFAVAGAISVLTVGAASAQQPAPAKPATGTPAPVILVIDRNAILRASKVGQSIVQQVNGYSQAAEKEFKSQAD